MYLHAQATHLYISKNTKISHKGYNQKCPGPVKQTNQAIKRMARKYRISVEIKKTAVKYPNRFYRESSRKNNSKN